MEKQDLFDNIEKTNLVESNKSNVTSKNEMQKLCSMSISDALQSEYFKTIIGTILYGNYENKKNEVNKYVSGVINAVRNNDGLLKCKTRSVILSILTSANLGLPVDSKSYAYLVPYKDQCTFIIGYKGYLYYAKKDKDIDNIEPYIIYEGDDFDYSVDDSGVHFSYKPNFTIDRSTAKKLYAVAVLRFKENSYRHTQAVVVPYKDIIKIIPEHFNVKTNKKEIGKFWREHEEEMAKKTAVRRLGKWFLSSQDFEKLNEIDNAEFNNKRVYYNEKGELEEFYNDEEKIVKPDTNELKNVVPLN